jgi:hypothetical protein
MSEALPSIIQDTKYILKYQVLARAFNNVLLACYIYEQGYKGVTVTELTGSAIPFKRSLKSDNDEMEDRIFRSSFTLNIECTTEGQFNEFTTTHARKYKVCVTHIGVAYELWGWLVPDQGSEPWTAPPFSVSFLVTDGLGELKTKDFVDNIHGDKLKGKHTLMDIIYTILTKTNLYLHYREAINLYEENMDSANTDTMLDQTYVDVRVFEDDDGKVMDCYTVLDEVLKICGPAHLWQENGYWYIVSMNNRKSTFTVRNYDSTFTYVDCETLNKHKDIQITNVRLTENFWWEAPTKTTLPGWKEFNLIQQYGFDNNIFDYEGAYAQNGTNVIIDKDGTTEVHQYDDDNVLVATRKQRYLLSIKRKTSYPSLFAPWVDFIEYNYGRIDKSYYTYLKLHFNPLLVDDEIGDKGYGANQWKVEIRIEGTGATALLNNKGEWKYDFGDMLDTQIEGRLENLPFEVTSLLMPITGYLKMRVFVLFDGKWSTAANEMIFINPDDLQLGVYNSFDILESLNITTDISHDQNFVPSDFEVILGDFPDLDNADFMYKGGLFYKSGSYKNTTRWSRQGEANYKNLVNLISDEICVNHVRPQWMISGELRANFTAGSTIHDPNSGRIFMMKRFEYDMYNNNWDVDAVELCLDSEGYLKLRTGGYVKLHGGGKIKLRNS